MTPEAPAGKSRGVILAALAGAAVATVVLLLVLKRPGEGGGQPGVPPTHPPDLPGLKPELGVFTGEFNDAFDGSQLDSSKWTLTEDGDFKKRAVDLVKGRLRLQADTHETRDDTVKFLGSRSIPLFKLGRETRVTVDLDWKDQANGSYLSAGIVLSPVLTGGNPLSAPDFLRIEYIGVPPGKNGRIVIVTKNAGREQYLFTEGWPDVQREGRKIGLQHVEVVIRDGAFQVWENKTLLYETKGKALSFDRAHLYLQMSSHSNYPAREVFFDNVHVKTGP